LNGRIACWHEHLQDYDFKIVHIAGKINTPADALLRPPGKDVIEDSQRWPYFPQNCSSMYSEPTQMDLLNTISS